MKVIYLVSSLLFALILIGCSTEKAGLTFYRTGLKTPILSGSFRDYYKFGSSYKLNLMRFQPASIALDSRKIVLA